MPAPAPFRSLEEWYFSWYLDELKEHGFVEDYEFENKEIILSNPLEVFEEIKLKTKFKEKKRTILQSHTYLPDFYIKWSLKAQGIFTTKIVGQGQSVKKLCPFLVDHNQECYVEVKPQFDKHNMTREFVIKQKWVWQQYEKLVNLIIPNASKNCLFAKTFTPSRYLLTDGGTKQRLIKYDTVSIDQYVDSQSFHGMIFVDEPRVDTKVHNIVSAPGGRVVRIIFEDSYWKKQPVVEDTKTDSEFLDLQT